MITADRTQPVPESDVAAAFPSVQATSWSQRHPIMAGLWTGVSYGLLGLVLLLATALILVPKIAGGVPLTILSGSMEPNLPVGSLAVVLPVEPDDVRIGDIVSYLPDPGDPTAISHRVVAIDIHGDGSRVFTVKGDANSAADAPVQAYQIRAKVWYAVPGLGYLNSAVNGQQKSIAVYLVAAAFFGWAISLWWRAGRDRRRTTRQAEH